MYNENAEFMKIDSHSVIYSDAQLYGPVVSHIQDMQKEFFALKRDYNDQIAFDLASFFRNRMT